MYKAYCFVNFNDSTSVRQTFPNSASDAKPKPYTVFALTSDHWPNFCDVLVKVMFGVTVLFMTA